MKVEVNIAVRKEKDYELGDMFYNPKGKYKFVLCSRTIHGYIPAYTWYGVRENRGSISIVPDWILKECDYLGKSKGFKNLFEVEEEE